MEKEVEKLSSDWCKERYELKKELIDTFSSIEDWEEDVKAAYEAGYKKAKED